VKYSLPAVGIAAWVGVAFLFSDGESIGAYLFLSTFIWIALAIYGIKVTFDRHMENGVQLVVMLIVKAVIVVSAFMISAEFLDRSFGIPLGILCIVLAGLAIHFLGAGGRATIRDLLSDIEPTSESHSSQAEMTPKRGVESVVKADLCGYFFGTVLSIAPVGSEVKRGDVMAVLRAEPRFGGKNVEVKVFAEYDGVITAVYFKLGEKVYEEMALMRLEIKR
jgi:biotin carboxyl carrier protein